MCVTGRGQKFFSTSLHFYFPVKLQWIFNKVHYDKTHKTIRKNKIEKDF